jgi:hypothetical protein
MELRLEILTLLKQVKAIASGPGVLRVSQVQMIDQIIKSLTVRIARGEFDEKL